MTAGFARRLLPVLAVTASALMPGACARPEVLTRPVAAPTMPLPASASLPLPSYARPTGEEAASVALGQGAADAAPAPAPPAPLAPRTDATGGGEDLGEWLAADPKAPRAGTFRMSGRQTLGTEGLAAGRMDDLHTRPDGTWTRRNDNVYLHSDGSSTVRMGDVFFHSDGTWTRRSGNVLMRSDGSSCSLSAGTALCRGR